MATITHITQLTLTNLYNALTLYHEAYTGKIRDRSRWGTAVKGIITLDQIEELDFIHQRLDTAAGVEFGAGGEVGRGGTAVVRRYSICSGRRL